VTAPVNVTALMEAVVHHVQSKHKNDDRKGD
jgi:hypothetical protein